MAFGGNGCSTGNDPPAKTMVVMKTAMVIGSIDEEEDENKEEHVESDDHPIDDDVKEIKKKEGKEA